MALIIHNVHAVRSNDDQPIVKEQYVHTKIYIIQYTRQRNRHDAWDVVCLWAERELKMSLSAARFPRRPPQEVSLSQCLYSEVTDCCSAVGG